jgi:SulP family sulfate permease
VIIGSGINFIDVSGCEMLFEESRNMHLEGRELYMCSLKEEVVNVVSRSKCAKNITRVFRSKHEAVEAIVPLLDKEQCHQCKRPVFRQCEQDPTGRSNQEQATVGAVQG